MRGRVNKYELGGRGNEHPWVDRLFGRDDPHRWRHDVGQLHRPSAGHAAASEGRISTAMMARARSVRGADQSANWHIEIEATGSTSAGRCGVRPVRCSTVSRISPARSIANNPAPPLSSSSGDRHCPPSGGRMPSTRSIVCARSAAFRASLAVEKAGL
jgi:hypothetical protein